MKDHLGSALLFLVALPATTLGQSTALSALDAFPDCAVECITASLVDGLCSLTNQTCICTNEAFQAQVTTCVTASCTIPEALATRNASQTRCGAPVRDRSGELITLTNTIASVAGVFTALRFAYKIFFMRYGLGMDDWFILATMVVAIPGVFITVYGMAPNGLGKDIWTLSSEKITDVLRYFYMMAIIYFMVTSLVKLSIVSFYLRVFPSRGVQRLLWATIAFIALWGVAYVFAAAFQCSPVRYFWTQWDGLHEGQCLDKTAIAWSNAAINIALDLWILAVPLWQLRGLQLHWKKKVGVALMFCVGTFVTVMSILRLQSLVTFAGKTNATWEFYDVTMWSNIELCVGIMCACLPTLRLLLVRLFPFLAGTTRRFNSSMGPYGAEGRSGPSAARGNTAHIVTIDRAASSPDRKEPTGIVLQKTYNVQYSDNDEISLVGMNELRKSDERR